MSRPAPAGPGGFVLFVVPTDLRPLRGLPARSPSAPRASLGASSRSPARPCRPRGGLHTGGACGAVCGGVSSRSPARHCRRPPAPRQFPPTASYRVWLGALVCCSLFRNVACNSPPALCWFVSVCSVVSLVFMNCMRLLPAGPAAAQWHRGSSLRCPPHRRCGATIAHRHRGLAPGVLHTSWAFADDGARRVGSMPGLAPTP